MPIQNFDGNTFVAFIDISGFKSLMLNREKAISSLRIFYQTGFNLISEQTNHSIKIEGFFISDCAVLFVRNGSINYNSAFEKLLNIVKKLNRKMLDSDLILTTSITFGYLNYEGKFEISGTEKNQIFGDAYVEAFLDNEVGKPKLKPGECRIVANNLPIEIVTSLSIEDDFNKIRKIGKHYYYYWMLNSSESIDDFITRYNDSYNLQYRGMLEALKNHMQT
jgi:hypothetical protein